MQLAIVLGMIFGSMIYFDAALLIAMVGFVSTVAMSKFLMRGAIIE
jgi:multicomponent K+:H+ antiporter subunit F